MKEKHLRFHGIPAECNEVAMVACKAWTAAGKDDRELGLLLKTMARNAEPFLRHELLGDLAAAMWEVQAKQREDMAVYEPKPWHQWGTDIEGTSIDQMKNAVKLPVAVRGALMPDAHLGYGLPIGGVLATRNAVIPYAVGVDIACRMKMTVLDLPASALATHEKKLVEAIHRETRFGMGARFEDKREHAVMDADWSVSPVTQQFKNKAWAQLGTSGSGNHFVEFGVLTLDAPDLGLEAGRYLAMLSHSGSRGTGAQVAAHYSRLAMDAHPELPKPLKHLAWLDLDSDAGQEYWAAMSLMGQYAAANHACIHRAIASRLGAEVLLDLENHHNYAWKETHDGEEVIVHRKGATPAGEGVLGIIPGSMADPGFVVRGKGSVYALDSASHGAGRRMSRTAAAKKFKNLNPEAELKKRGVKLLSAGLDELPMCYKNIEEVMAAQADLVDIVARFDPKLVKMAPAGEKPED
ncbi:MAG: RtcB family protein [Verrucomicrobia bacterium]|nr:RtcB family protein [Verrucomicrobiota bacterium]MCH8527607.1 RtcB family protein [Kiritimatiellia bacterium]